MEDLIDIIVENYILILIIVVVIVMIVVGYIADKTDFWHKKKTDSNTKVEEEKEEKLDINSLKNKKLGDVYQPTEEKDNVKETTSVDTNDLNAPFGDVISASKLNESTNSMNEDLNAPFGDIPSSKSLSQASNNIDIKEPINQGQTGVISAPSTNINNATNTDLFAPLPTGNSVPQTNMVNPTNNQVQNNTANTFNFEQSATKNEDLNAPFGDTPSSNTSSKVAEDISIFENPTLVTPANSGTQNENVQNDFSSNVFDSVIATAQSANYMEPRVPEFITEDLVQNTNINPTANAFAPAETNNSGSDEDIWKF